MVSKYDLGQEWQGRGFLYEFRWGWSNNVKTWSGKEGWQQNFKILVLRKKRIVAAKSLFAFIAFNIKGRGEKKLWKNGQADCLGWPPLPRSGQGIVIFPNKLTYFDLFYHFIMGKKGLTFSQIVLVRLEGGDPPPKAVSLTAFSQFFFTPSLNGEWWNPVIDVKSSHSREI